MRSHWRILLAILVFCLSPVLATAQEQQSGAEIIRGMVWDADKAPIVGARVIVTGLRSFSRKTTQTNAKGQYTLLFGDPEGEYIVSVSAIGYSATSGRARRTGASSLLVVDVILGTAPVKLDSLLVQADQDSDTIPFGGVEHDLRGSKLFSLDPSAVNSMMAQVPGVARLPGENGGPDQYSAMGVSPDQNSVLLDGTKFDGRSLPPDMIESATMATSTYNAARGNFAGGQVAMWTRAGRDRFTGSIETGLAHPSLAWTDPRAGNPVPQNFNMRGNISGPIKRGVLNYNFGLTQNTSSQDFVSLLSMNELQREQSGLSLDTIAAVQRTLTNLGIPVVTSGIPDQSTSRTRSAMLRLDYNPTSTTTMTFTGNADDSRQLGTGVSSLSLPSMSGGATSRNLRAQLSATTYFGGFIDQLTTNVQSSSNTSGPFLLMPTGSVRLGAQYPGGTLGLTNLSFGGGTGNQSSSSTRSWSLQHEISRLTLDSRHRLAFGQMLEFNWSSSRNVDSPFGAFTYQSLTDLELNRPASYSRMLSSTQRTTQTTIGALWLQGESRMRENRLQLEYGLRLDFAHAGTKPQFNPVVDSVFGRATSQVPKAVGLSPRLGFTWQMTQARQREMSYGRSISLSGGLGAFRGVIPPNRITGLIDATGLPNALRQLNCVGDATPIPDWQHFDAGAPPVSCLDGAAPVEFSTSVPSVQLFNPAYRPPTSWRGNLNLQGLTVGGVDLGAGVDYSLTKNGESGVDLNLRRTPVFALAEEGGRPMYVSAAGIVPTTGAIAPGASRMTDRFGTVTDYISDLEVRGYNVTLRANLQRPLFGKIPLMFSYGYSQLRQQERGFNGSTGGDPFLREWARGIQPTHQFQMSTNFQLPYVTLGVQTALTSGTPYTPMVMGDVNGDGSSNDRAFVFDPTTTGDAVLAEQMRGLLSTATPSTRACLERQLGQIAARNSCTTGWRLQPNVRFDLRLPGMSDPNASRSGFGDRLKVSVTTTNLMGTLLHLVGVSSTSMNVMSGANYPLDRTLLYVDGFDPETQRFRYRVNQQFGEGRPQRFRNAQSRYTGAFQVQLGARLQLGAFERQYSMAQQLGLVSADKKLPPPTEAEVRERLRKLTQDPVSMILEVRDSVLLTEEQVKRLEARQAAFLAKSDSVLAPILDYIVKKGGKAKDSKVQKLISKAHQSMWPMMNEQLLAATAELKPEQKERLPLMVQMMIKASERVSGKPKGKKS